MHNIYVIKIGGDVIDDIPGLDLFLTHFCALEGRKLLVHGGGKLATVLAGKLGIPQKMIEGRRITDEETLQVVTMVYGGLINKQIVAAMQAKGSNAIGLTGADGNMILAHKRKGDVDFGFAGDIDQVDLGFLESLFEKDMIPVVSPLTHDGKGQLLNTNADTIAGKLAEAIAKKYKVHLVYCFDKPGVLKNAGDPGSLIRELTSGDYQVLKDKQVVFAGMIPKLDNAFAALGEGVSKVSIGNAKELKSLIDGSHGTLLKSG